MGDNSFFLKKTKNHVIMNFLFLDTSDKSTLHLTSDNSNRFSTVLREITQIYLQLIFQYFMMGDNSLFLKKTKNHVTVIMNFLFLDNSALNLK